MQVMWYTKKTGDPKERRSETMIILITGASHTGKTVLSQKLLEKYRYPYLSFMFPQEAFREILLNAVVHKDYSACNPIQISVYEDKIYIWNDGEMPSELDSTEKLFEKHSSKPYNPKLANVFFKSGMIEAWGRGFDKIKEACAKYNGRLPEYNISVSGIMVLCKVCDKYLELLNDKEDLHLGQSDQDYDQDDNRILQTATFC